MENEASAQSAATATLRPYEAMFLAFNKEARKDHGYLEEHIQGLLAKVGAKVVRFHRWDQRQLAYEIAGQRDGIFYLCYFEAPTSAVAPLRREAELSDLVLRLIVLALESIPSEDELRRRSSSTEEAMREGEELRGEGGFDGGERRRRSSGGRRDRPPHGRESSPEPGSEPGVDEPGDTPDLRGS